MAGLAGPGSLFLYRARAVRVIDGDTIDIVFDQGFYSQIYLRVRLLGINCPEVHGSSRPDGLAATIFTQAWIDAANAVDPKSSWPLIVRTAKADDFGRWLGVVYRASDQASLNNALLTAGHAVVYRP